jgi:hypothetical protein
MGSSRPLDNRFQSWSTIALLPSLQFVTFSLLLERAAGAALIEAAL